MERINTEILVSSLVNIGFDVIDPIIYTYSLACLEMAEEKQKFEFVDQELSPSFKKYIEYDGFVFRIKEGYTVDTNVSEIDDYEITLAQRLKPNKHVIESLNKIDYKGIVSKKKEAYNVDSSDEIDPNIFSKKEIEMLKTLNTKPYRIKSNTIK